MTANHLARMTAKRLSSEFGDELVPTVENVIQSRSAQPGQFIDLGTLAAVGQLILQCAFFVYEWKRDHPGDKILDIEALKRSLHLKVERPEDVSEKEQDQIIDAIAEEAKAEE